MFDQLTTDELRSLMAALITTHGYGSNKMSLLLADSIDFQLQETYAEIATEIGRLHIDVSDALVASYEAAA